MSYLWKLRCVIPFNFDTSDVKCKDDNTIIVNIHLHKNILHLGLKIPLQIIELIFQDQALVYQCNDITIEIPIIDGKFDFTHIDIDNVRNELYGEFKGNIMELKQYYSDDDQKIITDMIFDHDIKNYDVYKYHNDNYDEYSIMNGSYQLKFAYNDNIISNLYVYQNTLQDTLQNYIKINPDQLNKFDKFNIKEIIQQFIDTDFNDLDHLKSELIDNITHVQKQGDLYSIIINNKTKVYKVSQEYKFGSNISEEQSLDPSKPVVECTPNDFVNLITTTYDAMILLQNCPRHIKEIALIQ